MNSTLVFCTSYFEKRMAWKKRYRRWLDYNAKIFPGAALFMIDDGSPYLPQDADIRVTEALEMLVLDEKGTIFRFPDRLGRPFALNYPGWFRSFTFSVAIAKRLQVRRIVHIESDAYILSRRALDFINGTNAGWTVFWCAKWGIPETSLQIVCDDCFAALEQVRSTPYATHYAGKPVEGLLPYTHIEKGIYGNRYGEYRSQVPNY